MASPSLLASALSLPQVLRVGAVGQAVTLLHAGLLSLQFDEIPVSELASATFGAATRSAVFAFQQKIYGPNSQNVSGIVDQDTAAVLLEQLRAREPDPTFPFHYFIAGRVTYADGSAESGLTIKISDRVLRTDREILATTTDGQGYFFSKYTRRQLSRAV